MPMEKNRPDSSASHAEGLPKEDHFMKSLKPDELLKCISDLSEEKRLQVATYVQSLKNEKPISNIPFNEDRVQRRRAVLKKMKKLSVEISKSWSEDIDAADLVSSTRR